MGEWLDQVLLCYFRKVTLIAVERGKNKGKEAIKGNILRVPGRFQEDLEWPWGQKKKK